MFLETTRTITNSSVTVGLEFAMHTLPFNESCFAMTNIHSVYIVNSNPLYFVHVFPETEGALSIQLKPGRRACCPSQLDCVQSSMKTVVFPGTEPITCVFDRTPPAISFLANHQTFLSQEMFHVIQMNEETNLAEQYAELRAENSTVLVSRVVSSTMYGSGVVFSVVTSSKSCSSRRWRVEAH